MPFENAFHVLIVPLVHFLYVHTFENAFYVFGLDTCRNVPPQLNLEVVHALLALLVFCLFVRRLGGNARGAFEQRREAGRKRGE